MKKQIASVLLVFITLSGFAQTEFPLPPSDKALIVFIRPPEMANALDNWVLMADGEEFCRVSNI